MPARPHASDERIAQLIRSGLTIDEIQREIGYKSRSGSGNLRIHNVAKKHGLEIAKAYPTRFESTAEKRVAARLAEQHARHARATLKVGEGVVLVGSDAHYWPGIVSTAHRAFVRFCSELRPVAVVMNGDVFDGATVSRYPRIGWDSRPTVVDELKAVEERLTEIEQAGRTKNLIWPLGNHDARYEVKIANSAPEYEGVRGFSLKDHFPMWKPCWAAWINDDTVVKHRFRSGIHATHNNALWAGKTIVTGHLHSLQVRPFSDYGGTRYGVDTGTLAQVDGPQFTDYTEDNPRNWRAGFAVLTYWRGRLLWPELVHVIDEDKGLVQFRGQVLKV